MKVGRAVGIRAEGLWGRTLQGPHKPVRHCERDRPTPVLFCRWAGLRRVSGLSGGYGEGEGVRSGRAEGKE